MRVQLVQETARQTRTMRSPKHTFNLVTRPWQIQPFMIAPVLPGETLKSLTMQARVVTDPVKSKLVGWWHETYFFYVKHRDLTFRDQMIAMHLTGASLSPRRRLRTTWRTTPRRERRTTRKRVCNTLAFQVSFSDRNHSSTIRCRHAFA